MIAQVVAPQFTFAIVIYGAVALGVFVALWIYYDRRDRSFYESDRRKISFHCIRCDHLYTAQAGTETAPCPKCGHVNTRLKF